MMEARRQFSRLGWAYVIFFLISNGVQILMGVMIGILALKGRGQMNLDMLMLLSQLSMYGVGFPVFYLLIKRIPAWKLTEKKSLGIGQMILIAIICFGLTYLGNIIGQVLMLLVRKMSGIVTENPVDTIVTKLSPWAMLLSTVLIAPVMEELMFRKFLVDRTVQYGQKTAVIVSGVGFGLFHGNFFQFFYACAIGMVFAYLYSYTGKIRYNILLHMIINFMGGFVALLLARGMEEEQAWAMTGFMLLGILVIGSIVAAIVLVCVYARRIRWFTAWAERPGRGIGKTILLAPGIIGYLVMSIVVFVLGI